MTARLDEAVAANLAIASALDERPQTAIVNEAVSVWLERRRLEPDYQAKLASTIAFMREQQRDRQSADSEAE